MDNARRQQNVLIIDDDPDVREVVTASLELSGYRVFSASSSNEAEDVLRQVEIEAVLLDLVLGDESGLNLLAKIRASYAALPVIIVTGHPTLETAVAAMRGGATDFVTKPVDGTMLDLRLQKALEVERTRRLANTDGLTGLFNHRFFQERLTEEFDRAQRYEKSLALVLVDIDFFKNYNDHYGHPRGDQALIRVARILRRSSRTSDIIARYGGEEFAALLPEASGDEAWIYAERVRSRIAKVVFGDADAEHDGHLTVSCGIAVLNDGASSPRELLQQADEALYSAKREGRNRTRRAVSPAPSA